MFRFPGKGKKPATDAARQAETGTSGMRAGAGGLTTAQRIENEVERWDTSSARRLMTLGEQYYCNNNDILWRPQKSPTGWEAKGASGRSDNRLSHPFLRKLVDQKTGYLLGKPFSLTTPNVDYHDELLRFFDDGFFRCLKDIGEEAVIKGIAWLQVYYDEDGQLSLMKIPSEQVVPIWKDLAHTRLDAIIRRYEVERYEGRERRTITKAEYWDKTGVQYFELDGERMRPDEERGLFGCHFMMDGNGLDTEGLTGERRMVGLNWDRLPFIPFKYNKYELPLIQFIKAQIDDYDARRSEDANNLEDLPDSILVLKNYDGEDLSEFRRNLNYYRAVKVRTDGSGGGGVDNLSTPMNADAVQAHIERTRRDIYEFGRGVDTSADKFSDPSGVALEFLYSDLDLDCNIMETEFSAALQDLIWFISRHLYNTGRGDFTEEPVKIRFNRSLMINENEKIAAAKDSVGLVSQETILAHHPWVEDPEGEKGKLQAETSGGAETAEIPGTKETPEIDETARDEKAAKDEGNGEN